MSDSIKYLHYLYKLMNFNPLLNANIFKFIHPSMIQNNDIITYYLDI